MKSPILKKHPHIGLFGGMFDPIHNGHLKAALNIKKKLKLDHLYFVPAYISPLKTGLGRTSSHHRVEMIKRAIQNYSDFSISKFELKKKEISYTIDTIKHYKGILPKSTELYFILGSDAFLGISKWKNYRELFSNCHMIVVSRPGYKLKSLDKVLKDPKFSKQFSTIKKGKLYKHITGYEIRLFQLSSIDISSTELRKKIINKEPYSSFISLAIEDYIKTYGLYKHV